MQQIAEWLAKIGLERYAPAFIENDIDVSVLRYLTDEIWRRSASRWGTGENCWR